MTRPKVDPEKRQRTAQACDTCKRRKQKCDGQSPCATCTKKQFGCSYSITDRDPHSTTSPSQSPAAKRRMASSDISSQANPISPQETPLIGSQAREHTFNDDPIYPIAEAPPTEQAASSTGAFPSRGNAGPATRLEPDMIPQKGMPDEEADNHTMTRMLEDGTGRLCEFYFRSSMLPLLAATQLWSLKIARSEPFCEVKASVKRQA
ncbi:MAG: hypothetical protein Q9163_002989 [Psora crenata]